MNVIDILEPVHFWTHVDRNFFAYFGVGNTQEKFVTGFETLYISETISKGHDQISTFQRAERKVTKFQ